MKQVIFVLLLLTFFGCAKKEMDFKEAMNSITIETLSEHIEILASDEFEGRSPSSAGEVKTINYLRDQYKKLGLRPGNGDSFFQEVPLVEIIPSPDQVIEVKGNGKKVTLKHFEDYVAVTRHVVDRVSINDAELVFVGYGSVAPEYDWNDYEGIDMKGKVAVVLVNDPGFATQNPSLFNGNAMTYYGRWTYKYEEAAKQGAAGVIIVHNTKPAGYPWGVVQNGWTGSQFNLVAEDNNLSRCPVEGWITFDKAKEIFDIAGLNFEELYESASKPGFKPIQLDVTTSISISNVTRRSSSNNVIALLPGKERADEYIFYLAHWDHFGIDTTLEGNQIYNGAVDNATGTAALLELAKAYTLLPEKQGRSIVFLHTAAEEQGLLGSLFYAENPIYPIEKTIAALNLDGLNIFGRTKDIFIIGYGNSELEEYAINAAKRQNRTVVPDDEPEKGYFYRSDHFSFAKKGVPALYTKMGFQHIEKGEEWLREKTAEWTRTHYHQVTDEYNPEEWDLSGAIEDIKLFFKVGARLSMTDHYPNYKEGNEFRAVRDASLKAAGIK